MRACEQHPATHCRSRWVARCPAQWHSQLQRLSQPVRTPRAPAFAISSLSHGLPSSHQTNGEGEPGGRLQSRRGCGCGGRHGRGRWSAAPTERLAGAVVIGLSRIYWVCFCRSLRARLTAGVVSTTQERYVLYGGRGRGRGWRVSDRCGGAVWAEVCMGHGIGSICVTQAQEPKQLTSVSSCPPRSQCSRRHKQVHSPRIDRSTSGLRCQSNL